VSFAHMHTHTHSSAFDGLGKAEEFCRRAVELGQTSIAFTEHGSLRGLYEQAKACEAAGIKLIPGIEAYFADDALRRGLDASEKADLVARHKEALDGGKAALKAAEADRRDRAHVTIWALTDEGLRNLYRLTSWAWTEGFYFRPRIDLERLRQFNAGLAVSTGCPSGIVARPLHQEDGRLAARRMTALAETFGDRLYVEVMPHLPTGVRRPDVSGLLIRIADSFGARLIATQDAHYPRREDSVAQDVLLCVHTNGSMSDPDRFAFDGPDYWLRSRDEMIMAFRERLPGLSPEIVARALDETLALADRCEARVQGSTPGAYLVAPALPPGISGYPEWLGRLAAEGLSARFPEPGEEVLARVRHELQTIVRHGLAPYFLAIWDTVRWARSQGILVGPGRGSAAGSLVSYLLQITDIDPLRYGLSFERFLAPGRIDVGDIDLDFEDRRRKEVVDYLRQTYGEDRVAHIQTHNTFGGRRALRDLARVHGVPEREVAEVANLIPRVTAEDEEGADSATRILETTEAGQAFARKYPDVNAVVGRLEGQLRDVGLHAAGIVVSSVPISEVCPLETRARGDARVACTAWDMKGVAWAGLVKFDALGLSTLTLVARAVETIRRTCDAEGLDPRGIPQDDCPEVFAEVFEAGDLSGVFQFDTPSARRICAGLAFRSLADVAAVTALNRPGPMLAGLVNVFRSGSASPGGVISVHPIFDQICAETYGTLIYQEQVIALATDLAGFSAERADGLRQKISKKLRGIGEDTIAFVEGAMDRGMDREDASDLFAKIVGFGRYSFNKCLDRETKVATPKGERQICALAPGDAIDSSEGIRRVVSATTTRRIGYRLRLEDGREVIASAEHRFFRSDWSEVTIDGLCRRDAILVRSPGDAALVPARIVAIEKVGPRAMIDIEVEAPHNFFLANGILSHNSHSFSYGALAVQTAWLKLHFPGPFFAAALEVAKDAGAQIRLAAAARRRGVPIGPPEVNASDPSSLGFADGEIIGALRDLKGVGEKAGEGIRSQAPYTDLVDFVRRAGSTRGVTVATFERLARADAFRRIASDLDPVALATRAREVWAAAKKGDPMEALLAEVRAIPVADPATRVAMVSEVWPLYEEGGMGLQDHVEAALRRVSVRPLFCPGDPDLGRPDGSWALYGRIVASRVFPGRDGKSQSARLTIASSDGEEVVVRVDQEIIDRGGSDLVRTERLVLMLVRASSRGNLSADMAWVVGRTLPRDRLLGWFLRPAKTRPKDPEQVIRRLAKGERVNIEGLIVRRRDHRDRNGDRMLTLTLLGMTGSARLVCFARATRGLGKVADLLDLGAFIHARIERLDGGASLASVSIVDGLIP